MRPTRRLSGVALVVILLFWGAVAASTEDSGQCLSKLFKRFPPVAIRTSELALDQISIGPSSDGFSIRIPLKQPHDGIRELYQPRLKDLDFAIEFLRLLQTGRIGGVTVDAFDRYFYLRRLEVDQPACESVAVERCEVCNITHWNNVVP